MAPRTASSCRTIKFENNHLGKNLGEKFGKRMGIVRGIILILLGIRILLAHLLGKGYFQNWLIQGGFFAILFAKYCVVYFNVYRQLGFV
jgi:hypothetical protein